MAKSRIDKASKRQRINKNMIFEKYLTKREKETIISFNEEDAEADVYTYNKRLIKKTDRLCKKFPKKFQFEREEWYGRFVCKYYKVEKKYVDIISPRESSEEHNNSRRENLSKARDIKSKKG